MIVSELLSVLKPHVRISISDVLGDCFNGTVEEFLLSELNKFSEIPDLEIEHLILMETDSLSVGVGLDTL